MSLSVSGSNPGAHLSQLPTNTTYLNADPRKIEQTCKAINQSRGHRGNSYRIILQGHQGMIEKLESEVRSPLLADRLDDVSKQVSYLGNALNVIEELIPSDVGGRDELILWVEQLKSRCTQYTTTVCTIGLIRSFGQYEYGSLADSDLERRKICPILSIDGGGIRGIIPAKVLVKIEEITKKTIAKLFRIIGGTSTGGILGLGLVKPDPINPSQPQFSAKDLLKMYTTQYKEIFRENVSSRDQASSSYQTPTLFQEKFRGTPMSSALTHTLITGNTMGAIRQRAEGVLTSAASALFSVGSALAGNGPMELISFDAAPRSVACYTKQGTTTLSYRLQDVRTDLKGDRSEVKGDMRMADVAQITSAAPTYFPADGERVDGGVLQNNPAIPTLLEALHRKAKKANIFMLSLGTGELSHNAPVQKESPKETGVKAWFQATQTKEEEEVVANLLEAGAYHRLQHLFQTRVPDHDAKTPEAIAELVACGDALVQRNIHVIEEICEILEPGCTRR